MTAPVAVDPGVPAAADPTHDSELLNLARRAVADHASPGSYVQAFVERTVEVRVDTCNGETAHAAVELREGVGVLIESDGTARYRSAPLGARDHAGGAELGGALEAALDHHAVPAQRWWTPPVRDARLRSIEDCVVRTFAVADSTGVATSSLDRTVRQRLEVVLATGPISSRGMSRRVFRTLEEDTWSGAAALVGRAYANARRAASAVQLGSRRTPVVFGPGAATSFLHELVGHAMEIDNDAMNTPYLQGLRRPGAVPACLTLVDDPTVPGGYGSYAVDDEGTTARPHALVVEGAYVSPLTSRSTASRYGAPATANGRRTGYTERPLPRTSNTVARPGADALDAMHRDRRGVLCVGGLGSGMINLATGEYSFAGLECHYLTPDGSRVEVRDVALVGDALGTLARLEAVGPDFAGDNVTCGKRRQLVGVGVFGPSMRYDALSWTAA